MKHGRHCRLTGSIVPSGQRKVFRAIRRFKVLRRGFSRAPYTNVNIITAGGDQVKMRRFFASGKQLLLKVAQSMIDPACVIRLCADDHVLNKAILHNEKWVIDKINCNVLTVVVSKANPESGTIEIK